MKFTLSLALLLGLAASSCFSQTWSGMLVNAKCYAAEERNVNPTDTETGVDRDRGYSIQYCAPKPGTKSFAVVAPEGRALRFDSAGDAKASELVRSEGKQLMYQVAVTGERSGNRIQVASISAARER